MSIEKGDGRNEGPCNNVFVWFWYLGDVKKFQTDRYARFDAIIISAEMFTSLLTWHNIFLEKSIYASNFW